MRNYKIQHGRRGNMKSFRIENGQFVYNNGTNDHFAEIPLISMEAPDNKSLVIKENGVVMVEILSETEVSEPKSSSLMDLWAQLKSMLNDKSTWSQLAIRLMTKLEEHEARIKTLEDK